MVGTAATGPYLKTVVALLFQEQHAGWGVSGTNRDLNPRVALRSSTSAYVTWCEWGAQVFVDKATGKAVAGLGGERDYALARAHLVYTKDYQGDTTWLIRRAVNAKLQVVSGPNKAVEAKVCGSYA